ncbi:MAG: hypothetical protein GY765_43880 [bacterium]|nr:hypothetical protein [bacterium]
MKTGAILICLLALLLLPGMTLDTAAADSFTVEGYYKTFFVGFKMPRYKIGDTPVDEPAIGAVTNRLRLKLKLKPSRDVAVHMAYDFTPTIQSTQLFAGSMFFNAADTSGYRAEDFNPRLYPAPNKSVDGFGVLHNLDRLFVTFKTKLADITIGRQAIGWGAARVINPTDVIAPFAFTDLDTEERRGVAAVRLVLPLGTMSELDVGYVFGNKFKFQNSAFFLRGKLYVLKTDVALLLMGFKENLLLGFDLARSIKGAGFRFEAAYVEPSFFNKDEPSEFWGGSLPVKRDPAYFRASVGMDYNFSTTFYGFFEYHFNSAGRSDVSEYVEVMNTTAFREGADYFLGKHYLNLGVTWQLTPLMPFNGLLIFNVRDGSLNFSPTLEYNIKEDIYLSFGAYIGIGKRPQPGPCNPDIIAGLRSEFGGYSNMVFTSFRIYF